MKTFINLFIVKNCCQKYQPWPTNKTSANQWKPFWNAGISVPWNETHNRNR